MLESFNKYIDLKVLGFFLANPKTSINVNELARKLEVSPTSVNHAAKFFHGKGYLTKDEKGLAHYYQLDLSNPVVVSLKKAYGLDLILSSDPRDAFMNADENIISLALYGSYAGGDFDEDSDVDFLVVTPSKRETLMDAIRELEDKLGKEVNVTVFKPGEWRALAKKGDAFYKNIIRRHVLLYGSGLK
jgi:predicted nucleotidyltransferase